MFTDAHNTVTVEEGDRYPLKPPTYFNLLRQVFLIMSNIFLASDHHFHHANILNFKRDDGVTPLRSFTDVNHMNEYMVMQHNRVVGANDKVYFLGDISMAKNAKGFEILSRMNGEKILIKGNHDLAPLHVYAQYFKDVRACHQLDGMLLTHIPIHEESFSRWTLNIHGHLHYRKVNYTGKKIPDPRYYNVSMECLVDYTPISLEELKKMAKFNLENDF